MTRRNAPGRVISRLQRLCCAGFGFQSMIPQLMRELHDLVPSGGNTAHWCGTELKHANMYAEVTESLPDYLAEYQESRELAAIWGFADGLRRSHKTPAGDFYERMACVPYDELLRTDWYNIFPRRLGWERGAIVKLEAGGRPRGFITLGRKLENAGFSRREMRLLDAIAPFIAHAVGSEGAGDPFVDSDDKGLVLADGAGLVRHASAQAQRLLHMVRSPVWTRATAAQLRKPSLPDPVIRLCQQTTAWTETRPLAAPPLWRHRNAWGEFTFRVFPTQAQAEPAAPQPIGVMIERREPLRLKLLRRVGELPLSNRETELCLALLEGHSRGEIAERLHISATTAITHCRNLYAKLDVHNRMELAEKLRAL